MGEEQLLGTSAITDSGSGSAMYVPATVVEHLGKTDRVAWFIDKDGMLYIVPESEVGIKGK